MVNSMPEIRDLAVIGDRHTAALITRDGSIIWYCPQHLDCPSLFAALLDLEKGGVWIVALSGTVGSSRKKAGRWKPGMTSPTWKRSGSG
jgi:GH15 family glucan-1,4-alpha-glucosidase